MKRRFGFAILVLMAMFIAMPAQTQALGPPGDQIVAEDNLTNAMNIFDLGEIATVREATSSGDLGLPAFEFDIDYADTSTRQDASGVVHAPPNTKSIATVSWYPLRS